MVYTIPVLFKEAPLGFVFINGFNYVWDDDILNSDIPYIKEHAIQNYKLCVELFTLSDDQCQRISVTPVDRNLQ